MVQIGQANIRVFSLANEIDEFVNLLISDEIAAKNYFERLILNDEKELAYCLFMGAMDANHRSAESSIKYHQSKQIVLDWQSDHRMCQLILKFFER